jgi:hypothetical protein
MAQAGERTRSESRPKPTLGPGTRVCRVCGTGLGRIGRGPRFAGRGRAQGARLGRSRPSEMGLRAEFQEDDFFSEAIPLTCIR